MDTNKILAGCVCVSVNLSKYTIQRKADKSKIASSIKKEMVTFGKKILNSKELQSIVAFDKMICDKMHWQKGRRSLPAKFLKDGVYLIPIELWPDVEKELQELKERREALVDGFVWMFSQRINESVEMLGDEFSWDDYPEYNQVTGIVNVSKLREKFSMEWQPYVLEIPENLKQLNRVFYEEQKQKINETCLAAQTEIISLMRIETVSFIDGLISRLTVNTDGTKKPLHQSYFEKMEDFLETFAKRNIANDTELAAAIAHCKTLLGNADINSLKDSQDLRDQLKHQFERALEAFDSMKDARFDALDFEDLSDLEDMCAA